MKFFQVVMLGGLLGGLVALGQLRDGETGDRSGAGGTCGGTCGMMLAAGPASAHGDGEADGPAGRSEPAERPQPAAPARPNDAGATEGAEGDAMTDDAEIPRDELPKTDAEWKKVLEPEQYYVLRQKGTERPFTGKYDKVFKPGTYRCAGCGAPLFASETKYNSGCGWPAFHSPLKKDNIEEQRDLSLGMVRTEVLCSNCGGHLGHVFNDGPKPTGLRYCINSAALKLAPSAGPKEKTGDQAGQDDRTPEQKPAAGPAEEGSSR